MLHPMTWLEGIHGGLLAGLAPDLTDAREGKTPGCRVLLPRARAHARAIYNYSL